MSYNGGNYPPLRTNQHPLLMTEEILIQIHEAESERGDIQQTRCPHCREPLDLSAKVGASSDDLWLKIAKAKA